MFTKYTFNSNNQMTRLTEHMKVRIVSLKSTIPGVSFQKLEQILAAEGMETTKETIRRFWHRYNSTGQLANLRSSGRKRKEAQHILEMVDSVMEENDETTISQLKHSLKSRGIDLSESTILRFRSKLGWRYRGAAYCQMIREVNMLKRLQWAQEILQTSDTFHDVIWSDESTIQLESHKRFCCRKKGSKPRNKPRPKHPIKLHVWAGISWKGRTDICIFEGRMDANMYVNILDCCLIPFVNKHYPNGHRFMQDNDPKHTSKRAVQFFQDRNINRWSTPRESPDANPMA